MSTSKVTQIEGLPSEEVIGSLPHPDQVTLLFKNAKHTVLLSVYPSQSFPEIKALLLAALRSRNISSISEAPLPDNPASIEFGVLADRKDPSKGWVPLHIREQEIADSKGGKRKIGGKSSVLNESPDGAGLQDGSWVAFRIKKVDEKVNDSDGEEDDEMDLEDDMEWNVILPKYEDEEE